MTQNSKSGNLVPEIFVHLGTSDREIFFVSKFYYTRHWSSPMDLTKSFYLLFGLKKICKMIKSLAISLNHIFILFNLFCLIFLSLLSNSISYWSYKLPEKSDLLELLFLTFKSVSWNGSIIFRSQIFLKIIFLNYQN